MLLADMPEAADTAGEILFSGEIGGLFDRMLAAIGRDRASIYLAPMAGARVPARELDSAETSRLARHHVKLAAPRLLLLLGNAPSRALLGLDFAAARGRKHDVNHDGTIVPAIATFHPRLLLQQPARKADAWADLRMALEVLSV
jgi:DNA polymerase